jgi:hypothetical protein
LAVPYYANGCNRIGDIGSLSGWLPRAKGAFVAALIGRVLTRDRCCGSETDRAGERDLRESPAVDTRYDQRTGALRGGQRRCDIDAVRHWVAAGRDGPVAAGQGGNG